MLDPDHPLFDRPRPLVIAHRGASAHAPENTLAAFRLALEQGADLIETDLWLTADEQLVCHHDPTALRMTGDARRIDRLPLGALSRLEIRAAGRSATHRIPTLEALLDLVPREVPLVLELKDPRLGTPSGARMLAPIIAARCAARAVVVVAFDLAWLRTIKSVLPDCPVGHITLRNPLPVQPTEFLGPYWPLLVLNPFYVKLAHRRAQWVTPLDPGLHRRLRLYLRLGVDGVLTDDPAATRAAIGRLRATG